MHNDAGLIHAKLTHKLRADGADGGVSVEEGDRAAQREAAVVLGEAVLDRAA